MLQVSLITRPRILSNANIRRISVALLLFGVLFGSITPFGVSPTQAAAPDGPLLVLHGLVAVTRYETALSKTCISKAAHAELVNFCKDAVANRTRELAALQTWLSEYGGVYQRASLTGADLDVFRSLLTMPLHDFEDFYLTSMIERKTQARALADTCAGQVTNADLASLCRQLSEEHTLELRALKKWRCAWYGACEALASELSR